MKTLPWGCPLFVAVSLAGLGLLPTAFAHTGDNTSGPATAAASSEPEESAVRRTLAAVVRIEAIRSQPHQGRMTKAHVGGSGAIISTDGYVLTNYHVADDADYYRCHLTDGTVLDASCVGLDALTDLAVLKLDLSGRSEPLPKAGFADSAALKTGDPVWALGSPASLAQSVTRGVVSNEKLVLPAENRLVLDGENVGLVVRWILHDASIFPGNSGGPLVDGTGRIVGINEIGIARLGGAIPGTLAQRIANELIATGKITRGWSGLLVQPRFDSERGAPGVVVAGTDPDSPAAASGLRAGDVLLRYNGLPIQGADEVAIADFTAAEMNCAPGSTLVLDYLRGDEKGSISIVMQEREPALLRSREQRSWGAVFRNLTRKQAQHLRFPDTNGAWLESVRPGGAAGQAEPELKPGDLVVALDGRPVRSIQELQSFTAEILGATEKGRDVLVAFRREGALFHAVVDLRITDSHQATPQARRSWIGVEIQPLTRKLATRLGIAAESGVRITQVHVGTRAAAAGLHIGDVVLKIGDETVTAKRAEDLDTFARQVRQFPVGNEVALLLWRAGSTLSLPIPLERQPIPATEVERFVDDVLELAVRELAFEDRKRLQLPPDHTGLIVQNLIAAGWAALAGLENDDILLEADGRPLDGPTAYRAARDAVLGNGADHWRLKVERGARTFFVEIDLKPLKS